MANRRPRRLLIIAVVLLGFWFFHSRSSDSTPPPPPRKYADVPLVKSSYDWANHRHTYPISPEKMHRLPTESPKSLPRVQFSNSAKRGRANDALSESRRNAVREVFIKSWNSYKEYAWGYDELTPVSAKAKNTFGGYAATLVDALDTLWIMDLQDDFNEALRVVGAMDWDGTVETAVNVFETTIRHLGGLLSAYDLSQEPVLLVKAVELGDMLYAAFDTPNHMPPFWLDFEAAKTGRLVAGTNDPSASPCSLSLEFTRLSQLTGDSRYYDAIERVKLFLEGTQQKTRLPGMWPALINFRDETVDGHNEFTLGALADSLYEYLPKMAALLGGTDPAYEKMYRSAMKTVEQHLLFRPMLPDGKDILFSGTAFAEGNIRRNPESQHLTCFVGGMFGLGGKLFGIKEHVKLAERLARGCGWAYASFPTGLMPEIFGMVSCSSLDACEWDEERWRSEGNRDLQKGFSHARDPRYILRPEAIESIFLLYRMTGDREYQEIAWTMFQSIVKATETKYANSAIEDVTVKGETKKLDSMESFWLAETLKYFYLIFSPPDLISLDEFVLNTEAHPLRRHTPGRR
ncbi:Endoplasmic reticulum mannosyl-oligosaccharide 1,2-alpha-mannosidase [Colletotrichum sidae]|uniref:alpha-1,2-Mannosidase n=2 Tax=Colletotrichum orbiculare species complex TaxID=2707354 RepID=N4VG14_COLOR|nr:Endoplasmic reticulum mannosyl-oligosaccharide 1,2-alpha-mannosidase [Colletotrichum orbiculare MAFF 240422]TEA21416.1 Endoplasmic reticulum mannosyl-oligosaccharide 1,2-alpha-mannosidase [Colletotrichum sidae]